MSSNIDEDFYVGMEYMMSKLNNNGGIHYISLLLGFCLGCLAIILFMYIKGIENKPIVILDKSGNHQNISDEIRYLETKSNGSHTVSERMMHNNNYLTYQRPQGISHGSQQNMNNILSYNYI